jgi:hypothetical protein
VTARGKCEDDLSCRSRSIGQLTFPIHQLPGVPGAWYYKKTGTSRLRSGVSSTAFRESSTISQSYRINVRSCSLRPSIRSASNEQTKKTAQGPHAHSHFSLFPNAQVVVQPVRAPVDAHRRHGHSAVHHAEAVTTECRCAGASMSACQPVSAADGGTRKGGRKGKKRKDKLTRAWAHVVEAFRLPVDHHHALIVDERRSPATGRRQNPDGRSTCSSSSFKYLGTQSRPLEIASTLPSPTRSSSSTPLYRLTHPSCRLQSCLTRKYTSSQDTGGTKDGRASPASDPRQRLKRS